MNRRRGDFSALFFCQSIPLFLFLQGVILSQSSNGLEGITNLTTIPTCFILAGFFELVSGEVENFLFEAMVSNYGLTLASNEAFKVDFPNGLGLLPV